MNRLVPGVVGLCAGVASAQVVYSHFDVIPDPPTAVVSPTWELGEAVTLVGGAQSLSAAEFRFGAFANAPHGEGTLNLSFYTDNGNQPGALMTTFAAPVSLVGTGPLTVSFNLGSLSVPSPVWVAVRFVGTSGGTCGVPVNTTPVTVGSVSSTRAFREGGVGAWGTGTVGDWMAMRLIAGAAGCYPNCDNSTTPPVLNVQDFTCFLNRFAAADTYANCDSSTTAPVLNVQDFSCFLNAFAAGCS